MNPDTDPEYAIDQIESFLIQIEKFHGEDFENTLVEKEKTQLEINVRAFIRSNFIDDHEKLKDLENDRNSHKKLINDPTDAPVIGQENFETDLHIIKCHLIAYKAEIESIINARKKGGQNQQSDSSKPQINLGPNSTYVEAGSITGSNIGHNNKIDNSQYKNAKVYPTLKKNFGILDIIAPFLMNRYGKEKLKKGGIISIVLSLLPLISGSFFLMPSSNKFEIPSNLVIWLFALFMALFVLGIFLIEVTRYYDFMSCKVCKKEFTYSEIGTPQTEETKTRWGYNEVTYRQYKCRECGNIKKTRSIVEFNKKGERIASSGEEEVLEG